MRCQGLRINFGSPRSASSPGQKFLGSSSVRQKTDPHVIGGGSNLTPPSVSRGEVPGFKDSLRQGIRRTRMTCAEGIGPRLSIGHREPTSALERIHRTNSNHSPQKSQHQFLAPPENQRAVLAPLGGIGGSLLGSSGSPRSPPTRIRPSPVRHA